MKQKHFNTGQNRMVTIKVNQSPGFITFHFPNEGGREFYWIGIEYWISRQDVNIADNWAAHMEEKMWYSKAMTNFISNVLLDPLERNQIEYILEEDDDEDEDYYE